MAKREAENKNGSKGWQAQSQVVIERPIDPAAVTGRVKVHRKDLLTLLVSVPVGNAAAKDVKLAAVVEKLWATMDRTVKRS